MIIWFNPFNDIITFLSAQFAVSQSIVDVNDPQWQNALDVIIPNLSISAHNKELFVNTEFNIVHGRRYGLVGPNGAGKSTLLKMIAAGELKVEFMLLFHNMFGYSLLGASEGRLFVRGAGGASGWYSCSGRRAEGRQVSKRLDFPSEYEIFMCDGCLICD